MTFLLNDWFNILNGRFPKEKITKYSWEKKKHKLQKFLYVQYLAKKSERDFYFFKHLVREK